MSVSEDPNTAAERRRHGLCPRVATEGRSCRLRRDQQSQAGTIHRRDHGYYDTVPSHKIAGYAIYRLISREPAGQRELNDPRVQQAIHQQLHDAQKQLLQSAYLETLTDGAKVRNYIAEEILKQGAQ